MTEPTSKVARQIFSSAFWSYAGNFSDRAIRFVVFVIVARLVSPAEFGVVLISLLVVEALQIFLDGGLGAALIRQATVSDVEFDSAFLITLAFGFALSTGIFLGADAFARLVRQADAASVIRILALTPVINALGAIHTTRLVRDLGFKALATRTLAASLIASLVAVGLAYAGLGVWALVARSLTLVLCSTVGVWIAMPWLPRLRFDWMAIRTLLPTALRLLGSNLIGQINGRGFDFLAGLVLGVGALATFRIAGQTVLLIIELTAGPLTYVGYSVLSRHKDDPALFAEGFKFMAQLSALLIFPAFFGLFAVADELFPLVFGARWTGASVIVPFMCAICVPLYFQLMVSSALFAAGRADRILKWSLIEAGLTVVMAPIGAQFGLVGLAAMASLRLYGMIPFGLRWLRRDAGLDPSLVIGPALPCAAAAALMSAVVYGAKHLLAPYLAPAPLMASSIVLGVGLYASMSPLVAGPLVREMIRRPLGAVRGRASTI